jgi:hypothetical protein
MRPSLSQIWQLCAHQISLGWSALDLRLHLVAEGFVGALGVLGGRDERVEGVPVVRDRGAFRDVLASL